MASSFLGEMIVNITGDNSGLEKSVQDTQKSIAKLGKNMTNFGKDMTKFVTLPILGITAAIVKTMVDTDKNLKNEFDNIGKDLKNLAVSFGKILMPVIQFVINIIRDAIKWFNSFGDDQKRLILIILGVAAAIGPLTAALGALMAMIAANPIGAVVVGVTVAVAALSVAFSDTSKSVNRYSGYLDVHNKKAKEAKQATQDLVKSIISARREIADAGGDIITAYTEGLITFGEAKAALNLGITEEFVKVVPNMERVASLQQKLIVLEKERQKAQEERSKKSIQALENEKRFNDFFNTEIFNLEQEKNQDLINGIKKRDEEIQKINQKNLDETKKKIEEEAKAREDLNQKMVSFGFSAAQGILSAYTNLNDTRLAQIEQQRDAEGNLSEELKAEKRKLLEANKAAAIFSAVISTAQSVITTMAQYPWPWSLIPAGVAGALGAAQIAEIAGRPIPALADGGLVMPTAGGTQVIMAEAGVPEFAVPDRGDIMSRLADRISDNMDRPNVNNVTNPRTVESVNIDGKRFKAWIQMELNNGNVIVPRRIVR